MGKKKKISKEDEARIREYQLLTEAEHDPDIILDPDEAYQDFIENWRPVEEVMKDFPPDEPIDVKEWTKDDFRSYYKGMKSVMGKDAAWTFLYAKILERAGEGDGGVSGEELFGEGCDSAEEE